MVRKNLLSLQHEINGLAVSDYGGGGDTDHRPGGAAVAQEKK